MNILTTTPFPLQITAVLLLGLTLGSFHQRMYPPTFQKTNRSYRTTFLLPIMQNKDFHAWDNIPVISYLLLKGKCRQCTASIPLLYPIVEVSTALLLLTGFIQFGMSMKFAIFCVDRPEPF